MTSSSMSSFSAEPISLEMTTDPGFLRRIKRLILVSSVALGLICLLVLSTADVGWVPTSLIIGGWVSMPVLLAGSLSRPELRYLLTVPAGLVSVALFVVALGFDGSGSARLGWWAMTAGVLTGATLGAWFWYRWVPVPQALDEPFSRGRWALIAVHAGLVVVGGALVVLG
ncbi:MAG: hypothetical protein U9N84_09525 [Actinomycetota bacterium]|nr:hypothetical protein [Actinomycetota bacterium]